MEKEAETMGTSEAAEQPQHIMCGYLKKPFAECYCMHMSSINIPKILEFCAGEFKLCRIYRRHAQIPSPWQGTHVPTLCLHNV